MILRCRHKFVIQVTIVDIHRAPDIIVVIIIISAKVITNGRSSRVSVLIRVLYQLAHENVERGLVFVVRYDIWAKVTTTEGVQPTEITALLQVLAVPSSFWDDLRRPQQIRLFASLLWPCLLGQYLRPVDLPCAFQDMCRNDRLLLAGTVAVPR